MRKIILNGAKDSIGLNELYQRFIRKCKIKNLTEKSIESYEKRLSHFIEYYGGDTPIDRMSGDTIDEFVLWLKNTHTASDITINGYLRDVRALLRYGMECGYIKPFTIHLIKAEKKIKETYTDEELLSLLKKPDMNSCSFSRYKTWVFENYLLGTGNRLSTALSVKIKDVDFEGASIRLTTTKNRRQQIIPLSYSLSQVLREYLSIRGGAPEDYLFCDEYGNQAKEQTYRQLVRRYNLSRNVMKTSCHLFRHTFAKHWIIAGGDIFRLQKILGHSDLTVTKEYVQMFGQDLQMDFERFNPLDRISKQKLKITI